MKDTLLETSSDAFLVQALARIAGGDAKALEQLYQRVSSRLFGLALRMVQRKELAEDVVQEAMLTVWRKAADYQHSLSPPMAWLGLIVRSRALDALRRSKAQREHLQERGHDTHANEGTESNVWEQLVDEDQLNPQEHTEASEQAQALAHCLNGLQEHQRRLIQMAYYRDYTHAELAAKSAMPLGTVKSLIRRGLEKLRGCMAQFA